MSRVEGQETIFKTKDMKCVHNTRERKCCYSVNSFQDVYVYSMCVLSCSFYADDVHVFITTSWTVFTCTGPGLAGIRC